jgi:hypothetical protein
MALTKRRRRTAPMKDLPSTAEPAAGSDVDRVRKIIHAEIGDLHEAIDEQRARFDRFDTGLAAIEKRLKAVESLLRELLATYDDRSRTRSNIKRPAVALTDKDLEKGGDFLVEIQNPRGPFWARVTVIPAWTETSPTGEALYKGIRAYHSRSPIKKPRPARDFIPVPDGWGPERESRDDLPEEPSPSLVPTRN